MTLFLGSAPVSQHTATASLDDELFGFASPAPSYRSDSKPTNKSLAEKRVSSSIGSKKHSIVEEEKVEEDVPQRDSDEIGVGFKKLDRSSMNEQRKEEIRQALWQSQAPASNESPIGNVAEPPGKGTQYRELNIRQVKEEKDKEKERDVWAGLDDPLAGLDTEKPKSSQFSLNNEEKKEKKVKEEESFLAASNTNEVGRPRRMMGRRAAPPINNLSATAPIDTNITTPNLSRPATATASASNSFTPAASSSPSSEPTLEDWCTWLNVNQHSSSDAPILALVRRAHSNQSKLPKGVTYNILRQEWTQQKSGKVKRIHPLLNKWKRRIEELKTAMKMGVGMEVESEGEDQDEQEPWIEEEKKFNNTLKSNVTTSINNLALDTHSSSIGANSSISSPQFSSFLSPTSTSSFPLSSPQPIPPSFSQTVPLPSSSFSSPSIVSSVLTLPPPPRSDDLLQNQPLAVQRLLSEQRKRLSDHYESHINLLTVELEGKCRQWNLSEQRLLQRVSEMEEENKMYETKKNAVVYEAIQLAETRARELYEHTTRIHTATLQQQHEHQQREIESVKQLHAREIASLRQTLHDSLNIQTLASKVEHSSLQIDTLQSKLKFDRTLADQSLSEQLSIREELVKEKEQSMLTQIESMNQLQVTLKALSTSIEADKLRLKEESMRLNTIQSTIKGESELLRDQVEKERNRLEKEKEVFQSKKKEWEKEHRESLLDIERKREDAEKLKLKSLQHLEDSQRQHSDIL